MSLETDVRAIYDSLPQAESIYDDTPAAALEAVRSRGFVIAPNGECGCDSGRVRYIIACRVCGDLLHIGTTGPVSRARSHELECKYQTTREEVLAKRAVSR